MGFYKNPTGGPRKYFNLKPNSNSTVLMNF